MLNPKEGRHENLCRLATGRRRTFDSSRDRVNMADESRQRGLIFSGCIINESSMRRKGDRARSAKLAMTGL